ncbi:peptide chain release factor 2 [Caballeronia concitans]|uniref:Peptide chain release factor 2 n=1 Tax=Caballeronia concitans TaxID=1777133 RepID=A0A658R285_9BURK|nr:Peptide chain release factor 2 [Burkholderia sp. MR1]SAL42025.1 peptide chain release factor 2 [Caballeronia concitans]
MKRPAPLAPARVPRARLGAGVRRRSAIIAPFYEAEDRQWKQNVSTRSKAFWPTCAAARASYGGIFDYDAKSARLAEVNKELEDPNVWNDSKNAQALGREKKLLDGVVTTLTALGNDLRDAQDLFDMAREENDEDTLVACEADADALKARVEDMEFRRMFSNPADPNNCFIDIQAGAGGTEACDWASMLLRQYLRYCERKGFKTEVLEESEGDVAGIKSATIKVEGEYAYGYLRTETGIHRLVRKSPFDSSGGRHTSFSSVFVYPEIDDSIEIEINPADIRTDTYRASGAGGQHINKTDSAVRLTHAPTGIVVQCQNDRSQHRNRAEAMQMLKARLYEFEMRKRQAEQDKLESSKTDVGWGHQIRSYVLDQSRVKDLRTSVEMSNTRAVLDGDLDDFISASLKQGV